METKRGKNPTTRNLKKERLNLRPHEMTMTKLAHLENVSGECFLALNDGHQCLGDTSLYPRKFTVEPVEEFSG